MPEDNLIETFYDLYAVIMQETIDIFTDPNRQRAIARSQQIDSLRETLEIDPNFLYRVREVPPALKQVQQSLKQCNPFILSVEVCQLVLDVMEKSGTSPLPYEPFLKVPLWVEFGGATIGDDATQFSALFLHPDPHQPGMLQCDLLTPTMQQTKSLYFSAKDGAWELEQKGACESKTCEVARYTIEGQPFRIRDIDKEYCGDCACHEGGFTWAQLVKAVNHLLKFHGKPMLEQITERRVPVPHASTGKPLTRKQKEENSQASKRSRPNVVVISLSAPVVVKQRQKGSTPQASSPLSIEEEKETISVQAHYKVLVPGQGKPWKTLQIVQVENYTRQQKAASQRTRYHVIP